MGNRKPPKREKCTAGRLFGFRLKGYCGGGGGGATLCHQLSHGFWFGVQACLGGLRVWDVEH